MKLKNIVSNNFQISFRKLMDAQLSGKTMFKLKGLSKKFQDEILKFEHVRKDLVERFTEINEDGSLKTIPNEDGTITYSMSNNDIEKVNEDLKQLGELEVEITEYFSFDEVEKANLTTVDLIALDTLIRE